MTIECHSVYKRYRYNWILKELDASFVGPGIFGISGPNGSGKSTLLSMISGFLSPSRGSITHTIGNTKIPREDIFKYISIAAPYIDLIEEYTIEELLQVYARLKPFAQNFSAKDFLELAYLENDKKKPIKYFSSGMQQRAQLLLACKTDVPCLLLDEPSSFLDSNAKRWFYSLLETIKDDKLIIIASNDPEDLQQCQQLLYLNSN